MAASLSIIAAKDGGGTPVPGGLQALDLSGTNAGPWTLANIILDGVSGVNRAAVKAASTAPAAADPAFVVAMSPNAFDFGPGTGGTKTQRFILDGSQADPGNYETVAASQAAQVMGGTGAVGDFLSSVLIVPATTSPGAVQITDGAGAAITIFAGGANSVSNLAPIFVGLGYTSTSGAWKITTGLNVSAIGGGKFT